MNGIVTYKYVKLTKELERIVTKNIVIEPLSIWSVWRDDRYGG